jgi:hypothetical protein
MEGEREREGEKGGGEGEEGGGGEPYRAWDRKLVEHDVSIVQPSQCNLLWQRSHLHPFHRGKLVVRPVGNPGPEKVRAFSSFSAMVRVTEFMVSNPGPRRVQAFSGVTQFTMTMEKWSPERHAIEKSS